MRARLTRLRGLARRYRTDRRLPPQVHHLLRESVRLRIRSNIDRLTAQILRPIGVPQADDLSACLVLHGRRRMVTIGPLDQSLHDLRHHHATAVVDALCRPGVDVFLVADDGRSVTLGVPFEQRARALEGLTTALGGDDGWMLRWEDGPRSGIEPMERARRSWHVRNGRAWHVFQPRAWGSEAVGVHEATAVTFWDIGTSGRREMVGTRGQQRFDVGAARTVELLDGLEYPGLAAFPVSSDLERLDAPIDLVYTWVDGSDEVWRGSFVEAARRAGRADGEAALDPSRFRSRDELRFSLRSVWAHCGWARRIYLVTAGQRPDWLDTGLDARVRLVDHREILPADALPTFNSHAIESAIHRIDGLAEHFVYMNDDVFVGRPLRREAFFTPNGLARVFQSDARVPAVDEAGAQAVDAAARRGREILLERFGRVATHKPMHSPHPLRRSVMEEIADEFPEEVKRTVHSRFRSPSDLSIGASFALHYGIATGRAVFGEITNAYVNVGSRRLPRELDRILLGRDLETFCINETESTEGAVPDRERRLAEFFEAYFPVPAPWERAG